MTQINLQGQITIPPAIQQQLGLVPGTEVEIEVVGETLQLRKKETEHRGARLVETMRGKATKRLSTQDIMQLTREDV
jgi:AbrB family looped-hinge helix DNA binding protein